VLRVVAEYGLTAKLGLRNEEDSPKISGPWLGVRKPESLLLSPVVTGLAVLTLYANGRRIAIADAGLCI